MAALQATPDTVVFYALPDGRELRRQTVPWTSQGFDCTPTGEIRPMDATGRQDYRGWPLWESNARELRIAGQSGPGIMLGLPDRVFVAIPGAPVSSRT